jgi:ATP-dependent DNA ligase
MLARAVDRLPAPHVCGGGCWYEPKLDGYRAIALVDDDRGVWLYSRRGARFNEAYPEIVNAVYEALPAGTVVDGELVRWSLSRSRRSAHRPLRLLPAPSSACVTSRRTPRRVG